MFDPRIWWIASTMNLSGHEVQILQIYPYTSLLREAAEGLESTCEIMDCHEADQVRARLITGIVMVSIHRCLLDRAVHPSDLPN